jgi:hypothetical protein
LSSARLAATSKWTAKPDASAAVTMPRLEREREREVVSLSVYHIHTGTARENDHIKTSEA